MSETPADPELISSISGSVLDMQSQHRNITRNRTLLIDEQSNKARQSAGKALAGFSAEMSKPNQKGVVAMSRIFIVAAVMSALVVIALSQEVTKMADHGIFTPTDVKWIDAPNALPAGAKVAVLEGNPFNAGLYTMRLSVPAGYKIPPHWHAKVEHVTVISGKFYLGMGEKFDESKGQAMPAGTFGFLAAQMKHFAWASEDSVIQLHGEGPWEINYVNPSDDPRKSGK